LKKRLGVLSVVTLLVTAIFALSAVASNAEMWFSKDKSGVSRVTSIDEGAEIFIVVLDKDQDLSCDLLDKMSPDLKIMDPKTGAYIVWDAWDGVDEGGDPITKHDYLEETGATTGLFVSHRSFQVGTRESYSLGDPEKVYDKFTHVVDTSLVDDFQWGGYLYGADYTAGADDLGYIAKTSAGNVGTAGVFGVGETWTAGHRLLGTGAMPHTDYLTGDDYMIGRFENMDTIIGMYEDPSELDSPDIAICMAKIVDFVSTIAWSKELYQDAYEAAKITVTDHDENLNCNEIEYVPVFIMVNPGSWNVQSAGYVNITNFCDLKRLGGYDGAGWELGSCVDRSKFTPGSAKDPIRWYNIYEQRFIQLPTDLALNVHTFSTANAAGWVPVTFWARETGVSTGVFELDLNSILCDLGFLNLDSGDVLAAFYLDPNDEDDFSLDTAYIEENETSITSFTDAAHQNKKVFWIGRDPVYVQVIDENANSQSCCEEQVVVNVCDPHGEDDSEWFVLDELGPSAGVFASGGGTELQPVWDALGVGRSDGMGGFQLQLDNWKLEVFNEDHIYAQYNDVWYVPGTTGVGGLGDELAESTEMTAFPPEISKVIDANDVSFDLMSIADTQVYDGQTTNMWFLDRQGGAITTGYTSSDGLYIKVKDLDQDEDQLRREIIRGYWDGGQNAPFGPQELNPFGCAYTSWPHEHFVNPLLGKTNIFNNAPPASLDGLYVTTASATVMAHKEPAGWPKIYVLNPRNGRWAAVDLMENGVASGEFISVICIDLVSRYGACEPTLDVVPNDTVLAFYQDPSNHSDSSMISIKVGKGGGGTPTSQKSTAEFTTSLGVKVTSYTDADLVYVKVKDPSHTGETSLADAVTIGTIKYDLVPLAGATNDTFITMPGLDLDLAVGATITATYKDPMDPTDTSTAGPVTIVGSALVITSFFAGPTPSAGDVTFGYIGSGTAATMSVEVYDFAGNLLWFKNATNVTKIVWDGKSGGVFVANGVYRYFVKASDATTTKSGAGVVVINR
jgi:hypothetical protein